MKEGLRRSGATAEALNWLIRCRSCGVTRPEPDFFAECFHATSVDPSGVSWGHSDRPAADPRSLAHRACVSQLAKRRWPLVLRTDSGWNWTPSIGSVRCRTPMMTPSGVRAVTVSADGTVAGSSAREW
jgi:hypothetical protein